MKDIHQPLEFLQLVTDETALALDGIPREQWPDVLHDPNGPVAEYYEAAKAFHLQPQQLQTVIDMRFGILR